MVFIKNIADFSPVYIEGTGDWIPWYTRDIKKINITYYILFLINLVIMALYINANADSAYKQINIINRADGLINIYDILVFAFIIFLFVFVFSVFHEFLHLVFVPGFIKSKKTYLCIDLKKIRTPKFGVLTTEIMSKNRCIFMTAAPLIFLSAIPLIALFIIPGGNIFLLVSALLNIPGCAVDVLMLFYAMKNIPKGAVAQNHCYRAKTDS